MTKNDHHMASAKMKSADKMVMLPPLFDGTKPEMTKQHYERLNQYIKLQTKSGNINDPVVEAIELFEHTLGKKVLVWFQEHKDKFVDLTTLKMMFLQMYNPWGKTKRDQFQSWNILTFDLQKTDVNENIDLINTLGDMLGQKDVAKMEKFIDTILTIIQTHLITCKNWDETTQKAKELEHIIRKCDPPAAAMPTLTQGAMAPGLYSHIAQSEDKEETEILQPFKGGKPKQNKTKGRGKGRQKQKQNPPPVQIQEEQYPYEDTNNYYHTKNIEVNLEVKDHTQVKILVDISEAKIPMAEANITKTHIKANIKVTIIKAVPTKVITVSITTHIEDIIKVTVMANLEAEAVVMVEVITMAMVMAGPIIKATTITNIISIMVMMMTTSLSNMAHHVHYAMVTTTPPNIVLRENMTLII